jgi:hypothetical protein
MRKTAGHTRFVMAALVAAIHLERVGAPKRLTRSRTLARWMAGSSPAMTV